MAFGDNVQNVGFSIWSPTATLPSAATVGNSIIVISNADDAALTCSDDLNGAYTKVATFGSNPRLTFFLVVNTSAASAPVITLSTGGRRSFALEVEGELTTATGEGTFSITTSAGPQTFSTSANDIPANSVSIGAWGATVDGTGITPDSPWTGVSVDNQTYPFAIRQDTSAVAGGVFSGTYDGFAGQTAIGLFKSFVAVTPSATITNIDGDNSVRAGQTATVNGTGFGSDGNVTAGSLGGKSITVNSNTDTTASVTIPADIALKQGTTTNQLSLTVGGSPITLDNVTIEPQTGWEYVNFTTAPNEASTESFYEAAQTDATVGNYTMLAGDQLAWTTSTGLTIDGQTIPVVDPAATVTGSYKIWKDATTTWTPTSTYTITDQGIYTGDADLTAIVQPMVSNIVKSMVN